MPDKIAIILNEKSGDPPEAEARRAEMTTLLASHGLDADLHSPEAGSDFVAFARDVLMAGDYDMLVAAGGDGTIGAVASACHDADVPMGVIPQGTFNYFARGLDIPEEMDGAIRVLAEGRLSDLALGEVNGQVFLNNASLGIYPLILKTREGVYSRWGRSRIAAYWSVILALVGFRRPLRLRITLDGQPKRLRTPLAFVANSAYQLEEFRLDGAEEVRKGRFALFTSRGTSRMALVRDALRLGTGRAQKGEEFELMTGREIVIDTGKKRALVARDGEKELMHTPIRFRIRERPLRVVVPVPQEDA